MNETKVPARALRFDAQFELAGGKNSNGVPVRLTARGAGPVDHWYWGRIVHDFAGMNAQGRIPIDYCHDSAEVLGYASHFSAADGPLVISGYLTPFGDNDRANEVAHKAQAGVPYQASIFFDNPIRLEKLSDGDRATVNGREFVGPGVIVRQWTLRGVAICPYGADASTSTKVQSDRDVVIVAPVKPARPAKARFNGLSDAAQLFADNIKFAKPQR